MLSLLLGLFASAAEAGEASRSEEECLAQGWQRAVLSAAGLQRELLWKAPTGGWRKGAILVMHGGGGDHSHWCSAHVRAIRPQVRFSEMALAEGFAVFLLNSTDQVRDGEGRLCGKVWDDEAYGRPSLDLPFIESVIRDFLPAQRPAGSRKAVFLTGLSSGGFMTVRAATHFDNLVTAFAPAASGDPYGWHRVCENGMNFRIRVRGSGVDNETGKQIKEQDACLAASYPRERPWESAQPAIKPAFRVFRHEMDGIVDASCSLKLDGQLRRHGYDGPRPFALTGGRRGLMNHLWQEGYNRPVLDFFASRLE